MCSKALGFLPPSPPHPHLPSPSTKTSHHNHLRPTPNANVGFLDNHLSFHSYSLVPCYNAPLILPVEKFEEDGDIESFIVENHKLLSELGIWGIGGPCKYCQTRSTDFVVITNGSNCLFSDQGFDGLVIEPGIYKVGSGYPFNKLGVRCSNEGYSGLEFAGGMPGTVGGAAFMECWC